MSILDVYSLCVKLIGYFLGTGHNQEVWRTPISLVALRFHLKRTKIEAKCFQLVNYLDYHTDFNATCFLCLAFFDTYSTGFSAVNGTFLLVCMFCDEPLVPLVLTQLCVLVKVLVKIHQTDFWVLIRTHCVVTDRKPKTRLDVGKFDILFF